MPDGASESPRRGNPQSCTTPDEKTAVTGTVPMYRHVAAMGGFEIRQEWHRSIPRLVCLSISRYYALCTLHLAPCTSHLAPHESEGTYLAWVDAGPAISPTLLRNDRHALPAPCQVQFSPSPSPSRTLPPPRNVPAPGRH
jgi:hypothetical protein